MKETFTLFCVIFLLLMFGKSGLGSGNFLVGFSCFRFVFVGTSLLVGCSVGIFGGFSAEKMAISWLKFVHLLGVFLAGFGMAEGFFRLGILLTSGFGDFGGGGFLLGGFDGFSS